MTQRAVRAIWIGGSLAMLVIAAVSWSRSERIAFRATTPFEHTRVSDDKAWAMLVRAGACLPPGETVTALAPTIAQKDELYYLAVALLTRNVPLPASYFGSEHPKEVARARYVIYYGMQPPPDEQLRLICRIDDLAQVYERRRP